MSSEGKIIEQGNGGREAEVGSIHRSSVEIPTRDSGHSKSLKNRVSVMLVGHTFSILHTLGHSTTTR